MSSSNNTLVDKSEELLSRNKPFPTWLNKYVDINNSTYIEIRSGDRLYTLACQWLSPKINTHSFRITPKTNANDATRAIERLARLACGDQNMQKMAKEDPNKTELAIGLGLHELNYHNDHIYILHQTLGEPAACGWSADLTFFESLILIIKGKNQIQILRNLCDEIIRDNETNKDRLFFNIYRYNVQNQFWQHSGRKIARNLNTIVLPQEAKNKVVNDIERFLNEKSIQWYFEHGIPYKRSYLFYGVPGSGKSSLIQAIAAKFDRNLCFLQPTHPMMTDDLFKSCIQSAPSNSLIVLEDIDALFNKDRSKKHEQCPLTFSGLLNGLDGVGNPDGQIFILTTNYVNRLDDALIRSGRVDVHIEFPMATDEQLEQMFILFYTNFKHLNSKFVEQIRYHFPNGISMAAVQQHFIQNMLNTAEEVVKNVPQLGERLDVVKKLDEKSKIKEEDDKKAEKKEEKKEEKKDNDKDNEVTDKDKDKTVRDKIVDNLKGVLSSDLINGLLNTLESHIPVLQNKDKQDNKEQSSSQAQEKKDKENEKTQ